MKNEISIRNLKDQASRILREVREEGAKYVVTYHGKPVAVVRPFTRADTGLLQPDRRERELEELEELGRQIAAAWTSEKSALELIDEGRR